MEIFRKEALKRVSSPEQLDQLMTVINPVGWVALLISAIILVAVVFWGFEGRLPTMTKGPGLLMQPGRTKGIFSMASGQVVDITVREGQMVSQGMVVGHIQLTQNYPDVSRVDIISSEAGRVQEIMSRSGAYVNVGDRLMNLTGESRQLIAALFFPLDQGKKIRVGMEARISPSTVKEDDYGFLLGRVARVSPGSVTQAEMIDALGNPDIVKMLVGEGGAYQSAPIFIMVTLEPDLTTPSGYHWTSRKGPDYGISPGTACQASILTNEERPINLVIPYLKKLFGVKTWQE